MVTVSLQQIFITFYFTVEGLFELRRLLAVSSDRHRHYQRRVLTHDLCQIVHVCRCIFYVHGCSTSCFALFNYLLSFWRVLF